LQTIAYWLDGCISVPGTRWKVGLEPIIGLVPIAGDIVGLLLSSFIIIEGVRLGAPPQLTARMVGITVLDALSGLVPVFGDLFDFAFKANRRNADLLMQHLDVLENKPRRQRWGSRLVALVLLAAVLGLLAWGLFRLAQWLLV
jgi:hypothetical protein